jgi:hypothetical protein
LRAGKKLHGGDWYMQSISRGHNDPLNGRTANRRSEESFDKQNHVKVFCGSKVLISFVKYDITGGAANQDVLIGKVSEELFENV